MTTLSNAAAEPGEEGREVVLPLLPADPTVRSAQRARGSLSAVPSMSPSEAPETDTESDQNTVPGNLPWLRSAGAGARRRAHAALTGRSLLDIDPPAVGALWAAHRLAAKRIPWPVVAGCRTAWGAVHVLIVSAVYGIGWVLFSPAWTFVTALLVTVWILS